MLAVNSPVRIFWKLSTAHPVFYPGTFGGGGNSPPQTSNFPPKNLRQGLLPMLGGLDKTLSTPQAHSCLHRTWMTLALSSLIFTNLPTKFAETSVSETIRKPPLVKAKTALRKQKIIKYGEKQFSIWRMEFLHPAMWHDHDTDFARWLQPAMWQVDLGSWQWIHKVAAPCNVTRGSGMTCHWIRQVAAPSNVACGSGIMPVNWPSGSTLQCYT